MSTRTAAFPPVVLALVLPLFVACGSPSPHSVLDGAEALAVAGPSALTPSTPVAGADNTWLNTIQQRIQQGQYAATEAQGRWRLDNPAHHLIAHFDEDGVEIQPAPDSPNRRDWSLSWNFVAWGRESEPMAVTSAKPQRGECLSPRQEDESGECLRQLEYERSGITEWWRNTPAGLEQGWTISEEPAGEGPLVLELEVEGLAAVVEGGGDGLDFEGGELSYRGLMAFDALGRDLPAHLSAEGTTVRLVVDVEGAAWPVTVDPVLGTAAWTGASASTSDSYNGYSVASAGDVNGDGFGDVIVGAYGAYFSQGEVYVYLGSAAGLATTPSWSKIGTVGVGYFGISVASAGDVNGDGYSDVLVGSPRGGSQYSGAVYLYLGSATGLASAASWSDFDSAPDSYLGQVVAPAGDLNDDGYSDFLATALRSDGTNKGRVYYYLGSAAGPAAAPSGQIKAEVESDCFGCSLASAGDYNADGYSDVVVGAPQNSSGKGKVYVYLGTYTGLQTTAIWSVSGATAGDNTGSAVAAAGDVNGDGYGDILIGSSGYYDGQGLVSLALGTAGLPSLSSWSRVGEAESIHLGASVASAGDINGDGYADVVVGAPGYDNSRGRAYVYLGGASGLSAAVSWVGTGSSVNNKYGTSVASAGDVNGDGFGDVLVGVPGYQYSIGMAQCYLGAAAGVSALPTVTLQGETTDSAFGYNLTSGGDINGDGYSDMVVAAPGHSASRGKIYVYLGTNTGLGTTPSWTKQGEAAGHLFGWGLAFAGDVNGDGYGDLIVGANGYGNYQGKAYLYVGRSDGVMGTLTWPVLGASTGAKFGLSVAGAGDINGDGYGDVVVGSPGYSSNTGQAYVYLGTSSGPRSTPSFILDALATYGGFGTSVASVGDVNGDGLGDIGVAAPGYQSSTGQVYVYHGSYRGLTTPAAWTATGPTAGSRLGSVVTSAGDVNGDGYGDVAVGAEGYSSFTGRAYVYLGASGGVNTTPVWSKLGENTGNYLGASLASAGDVNGDGYGDVVVGAPGYLGAIGKAYLFVGQKTGLATTESWSGEGDAYGDYFGSYLASAGDINGDGFGDLAVGAYGPSLSMGQVYFYEGNTGEGTGRGRTVRGMALQPDTGKVIQPWGRSSSNTSATVKVQSAHSPFGRMPVGVVVETRPRGTPFSGTSLVKSTYTGSGLKGVAITQNLTTLTAQTDYHWRVRVVYKPSLGIPQLGSAWTYGGISGSSQGVHLRTACANDSDGDHQCDGQDFDADNDGYSTPADCDDSNVAINPAATEVCDGKDNDCDGQVDDGFVVTWYQDNDGDTYGSTATLTSCTKPTGYVNRGGDCDDTSAAINPGSTEICDAVDNDCDLEIDEGVRTTYYEDSDGDGYGSSTSLQTCLKPSGYVTQTGDCDDTNSSIKPGATEVCDGKDNDCDTLADEGVKTTFFQDNDGDGYGTTTTTQACTKPSGYTTQSGDCDDTNASIKPGATEVCDGKDNDCDAQIDEAVKTTFYQDSDGDGYGTSTTTQACSQPSGYTTQSGDCDDSNAGIKPGATEVCDGKDNDCDTQIDEAVKTTYYQDPDGDGYGNTTSTQACTRPTGYTTQTGDCDETNAAINPGAAEICDGKDNNCNGQIDDGAKTTWYLDNDKDNYGVTSISVQSCVKPSGYTALSGDCADGDAAIYPGAPEACDNEDNNCDGQVDEGIKGTYYLDNDKDGYGLASNSVQSCVRPTGFAAQAGDCDDGDANVNPGAPEVCDGLDNNCNGQTDEGVKLTWYLDADQDGYGRTSTSVQACTRPSGYASRGGDCDDTNTQIYPGATELCDGVDNNCNTLIDDTASLQLYYRDGDGDTYGANTLPTQACVKPVGYSSQTGDCDDGDASVHPGAVDIPYDTLDQDCVDGDEVDVDDDGYVAKVAGGNDCDDQSNLTYPGATEFGDGKDNDCDGAIDEGLDSIDNDHDGFSEAQGDCNDNAAQIHPNAAEKCDGINNDCDTSTDEGFDQDNDTHLSEVMCGSLGDDCDDQNPAIFEDAPEIDDGLDNNCDGVVDEGFENTTPDPTPDGTEPPTDFPTDEPTDFPTDEPTDFPTDEPTDFPTEAPTFDPTEAGTDTPTEAPTFDPTQSVTDAPTDFPTEAPTDFPTDAPTELPTDVPTDAPTDVPPTDGVTDAPTGQPTDAPTEEEGTTSVETSPTEAPSTSGTPTGDEEDPGCGCENRGAGFAGEGLLGLLLVAATHTRRRSSPPSSR